MTSCKSSNPPPPNLPHKHTAFHSIFPYLQTQCLHVHAPQPVVQVHVESLSMKDIIQDVIQDVQMAGLTCLQISHTPSPPPPQYTHHTTSLSHLTTTHLSHELSVGSKGQTQRLRVVLHDVFDTVVELSVNCLHVTQDQPPVQKCLVEWTNEESQGGVQEREVCRRGEVCSSVVLVTTHHILLVLV